MSDFEKPSCLNIGPDETTNAQEHFNFACQNCNYADGCRWVRDFYFDEAEVAA